jgi:hypothetical protein
MTDVRPSVDDWHSSVPIAPRLEVWWARLTPAHRTELLAGVGANMPKWVVDSLFNARIPLNIMLDTSVPGGAYHVPRELREFLDSKRVVPTKKRFWRRG